MGKTPRFDKYTRLLARFYETSLLLGQLGKAHGPRYQLLYASSDPGDTRRRFLQNLAFICDFKKGGISTTAVAVENTDECYKFWVASNGVSHKIVPFLREVLQRLGRVVQLSTDEHDAMEAELGQRCIQFAQDRLKKEARLFFAFVDKALSGLEASRAHDDDGQSTPFSLSRRLSCCKTLTLTRSIHVYKDSELASWIREFRDWPKDDDFQVCSLAYQATRHAMMHKLNLRVKENTSQQTFDLTTLRHRLGRLAAHVSAVKHLVSDATRLQPPMLDVFEVHQVPLREATQPPVADGLTTLPSILKRMGVDDAGRLELESCLMTLNHSLDIEAKMQATLNDAKFKTQIHAEVQLLDHFHLEMLRFVDNDRFVACSKPACWCCFLYFGHHPAKPVKPETNGNLHEKWGFMVARGADDAAWHEQRGILIKMIHEMRDVALSKMRTIAGPRWDFPDSFSGITPSEPASHLDDDDDCSEEDDDESNVTSVGVLSTLSSTSLEDFDSTPVASSPDSETGEEFDLNTGLDSKQGTRLFELQGRELK
ncbi:hypothetical protein CDD82_5506 [Ophiocordyceps australis]|uniref:Uncharacterized protein n=1 Tax=Ophiocordyceps australis TaxID=1399860 RepID=A0A2C5ZTA3_9HYPO|nr:hypothetical protein CDD82_5506 [Ophiocordyceps australis]